MVTYYAAGSESRGSVLFTVAPNGKGYELSRWSNAMRRYVPLETFESEQRAADAISQLGFRPVVEVARR